MKNIEKNESMTFEEALQDASLASIHETIRFLQKTPSKDIFPKKYELSMIDLAVEEAVELFDTRPSIPLKTVISTVIASFPDDLSADLIVKMTENIVKEWRTLSVSLQEKNQIAIAA
jgi:hypothetical protein